MLKIIRFLQYTAVVKAVWSSTIRDDAAKQRIQIFAFAISLRAFSLLFQFDVLTDFPYGSSKGVKGFSQKKLIKGLNLVVLELYCMSP